MAFQILLTEESQKKWKAFKARKRAYYSLIILLIMLGFSALAGLYANSAPYLVKYNGSYYFPFFKSYPETTFGGNFDTETDFSDPYIKAKLNTDQNWALYPPVSWDYASINSNPELQHPSPPSKQNWLGTDNRGRDVLARLIYGFRLSLLFGLVLAVIDSIIGILAGSIEGFFGGWVDIIFQRAIEIWSSVPSLYLLITFAAVFPPEMPRIPILILLMSLFGWIGVQGLVRIEFLKARNREYVKAARALGVTDISIMFRHILPNALTLVITDLPFSIAAGMSALVSLDFLGFGVQPPTPSLGELLNQGLSNVSAWWIALPTVATIMTLLILVTFVGEAVLDVFDPKRR